MGSVTSGGSDSRTQATAFATVDDLAEKSREAGWRVDYRQLERGKLGARYQTLDFGGIFIMAEHMDKRVHLRARPPQRHASLIIPFARTRALLEGTELSASDFFLIPAGCEVDIIVPANAGGISMVVPESTLHAWSSVLAPDWQSPGDRPVIFRRDRFEVASLRSDLARLIDAGDPCPERLSWLTGRIFDLIAPEPNEGEGTTGPGSPNGTSRMIAKRAESFIEEHFDDAIRLDELCRHVGASPRTVQRSFSEYFQASPLTYIKARRLHAARRYLMAADPTHHSVTTIALDSGFTHLGRFSVDYRRHFGESPKQTLQRSPVRGASRIGAI